MLVSRTSTNQNLRQDPDVAVLAEQVRLLYGSPIIVLINPVNASIVLCCYGTCVRPVAGSDLFLVVTGAKTFLAHRYHRQQQPIQAIRRPESRRVA